MSSEQDNAERSSRSQQSQDPATQATLDYIHIAEQVAQGHVPADEPSSENVSSSADTPDADTPDADTPAADTSDADTPAHDLTADDAPTAAAAEAVDAAESEATEGSAESKDSDVQETSASSQESEDTAAESSDETDEAGSDDLSKAASDASGKVASNDSGQSVPEDLDQAPTDAASVDSSEKSDDSPLEADQDEQEQEVDQFSALSAGVSLMFHAPDPEEIRRAAEEAAARQREAAQQQAQDEDEDDASDQVTSRRRRRRRRGDVDMELVDEEDGTITKVRAPRGVTEGTGPDEVVGLKGSTRLEAKRQRRRESRQFGRRRQVITEAEFLARREAVERKMLVRQKDNRIQIGVLEDGILAEHFVSHTQQDSLIGNVYVGKVQNVLPSMEAAFVDIGRGRNAVLYAGEVDWDAAELGNKPRKIENALKSGDPVLVQVTKDPVGHKGARLTSQVSLPGRYLVYVPGGSMTGISRKLPDVERQRLKKILKDRLPEGAGVIVRTAAEGASEEELTHDINRLRSQWEQIKEKSSSTKTLAPEMLYAEPDLTIKTVRDVFNEDFTAMVVQGEQAWDNIEAYVTYVAPDLLDRLQKWTDEQDIFDSFRVEEQIQKALDRKVYLPSGGSLVFDRTEAMTVVDVNTGKFTGSGGNLEETVTKNNLEAAEEIVRQLRLRDIGGIIVVDFIDMVLESNRELVLRRLVECLGRDRTKHQVAEVTSLGLVQMTRKRMGTGLLEIFSEACEACAGRGVVVHDHPLKGRSGGAAPEPRTNRNERKRSRSTTKPAVQQTENRNARQHHHEQQPQEQPDDVPQDEQSKARAEAARSALASIAAASHHEEQAAKHAARDAETASSPSDQAPESGHSGAQQQGHDQGENDSENGRRRKKRRGKRSRGRATASGVQKQSSSEDSATQSSDQTDSSQAQQGEHLSVTIQGEVIELPQADSDRKSPEPAEEPSLTLDSLTAAFEEEAPTQPERRSRTRSRSRRADSRPDSRGGKHHASDTSEQPAVTGVAPVSGGASQQTTSTQDSAAKTQAITGVSGESEREASTPAQPRARRRSRRATAPAGPGTAQVRTHEMSAQPTSVARFTADGTEALTVGTASAPTVVGVGVKAEDMKMVGRSQQ